MNALGKAIAQEAGFGPAVQRSRGISMRLLAAHRWLGRMVMPDFAFIIIAALFLLLFLQGT